MSPCGHAARCPEGALINKASRVAHAKGRPAADVGNDVQENPGPSAAHDGERTG